MLRGAEQSAVVAFLPAVSMAGDTTTDYSHENLDISNESIIVSPVSPCGTESIGSAHALCGK